MFVIGLRENASSVIICRYQKKSFTARLRKWFFFQGKVTEDRIEIYMALSAFKCWVYKFLCLLHIHGEHFFQGQASKSDFSTTNIEYISFLHCQNLINLHHALSYASNVCI